MDTDARNDDVIRLEAEGQRDELNAAQRDLLHMIVWNADRLESGDCPNIYSRYGPTLRALEARGLVTYTRSTFLGVVYTAVPTDAGRREATS